MSAIKSRHLISIRRGKYGEYDGGAYVSKARKRYSMNVLQPEKGESLYIVTDTNKPAYRAGPFCGGGRTRHRSRHRCDRTALCGRPGTAENRGGRNEEGRYRPLSGQQVHNPYLCGKKRGAGGRADPRNDGLYRRNPGKGRNRRPTSWRPEPYAAAWPRAFSKGKSLHITSPGGTDLLVDITDRRGKRSLLHRRAGGNSRRFRRWKRMYLHWKGRRRGK